MKKKIISLFMSAALAFSTIAVLPGITGGSADIAVTASAEEPVWGKGKFSLTVKTGDQQVSLSWNAANDALSYTVYCRKGGETDPIPDKTVKIRENSYTFTGLTNGQYYDFMVVCDNGTYASYLNAMPREEKKNPTETTKDGFVLETTTKGLKYIIGYNGKSTGVTIPKEVLYLSSFEGIEKLKSVTIPDTCKEIDWETFKFCNNLETVVFEGDINYVGTAAFWCCKRLKNVTFKGNVGTKKGSPDYDPDYNGIAANAFSQCPNLKTVTFEKKDAFVSSIQEWAFSDCISLKSIELPSNTQSVGIGAFVNCFELSEIIVPKSVTKIGDHAFGFKKSSKYPYTYAVADGVTKDEFSIQYINKKGKSVSENVAAKQLTLIVEKGSAAEKWAKDNKVKYAYESASSVKLSAPANIKTTAGSDKITLKWDAVDGAKAYRVFKYNPSTKKYEKYKDVSKTSCTVSGLKKGTKYQFKVAALDKVNGKYAEGGSSKAVSASTKSK